jgi:hypothetical protein
MSGLSEMSRLVVGQRKPCSLGNMHVYVYELKESMPAKVNSILNELISFACRTGPSWCPDVRQ